MVFMIYLTFAYDDLGKTALNWCGQASKKHHKSTIKIVLATYDGFDEEQIKLIFTENLDILIQCYIHNGSRNGCFMNGVLF